MEPGAIDRRASWALTASLVLLAAVLQWPLWDWMIDDAGISLAYARNIAEGLGPVAIPGAEPVEGYSNPLWVALLAMGAWLGLDLLDLAPALGVLTVAVGVVAIGQGLRERLGAGGALLAAAFLAMNAQVAIWAQSGLENGLFVACLALGVWRLAVPSDRFGAPLAFLGLALTRPEGLVYAAVAALGQGWAQGRAAESGAARMVLRVAGRWGLAFALPFVAYHLVRFGVFARELPLPYYVKVSHRPVDYFDWTRRQWFYLVRYAQQLNQFGVVALALFGLVGTERRVDRWVWAGSSVAFLCAVLVDPSVGPPKVLGLVGAVVVPVLWTLLRSPWRGTVGLLALVGLAFVVRANGDWMRGHRLLSLVAVPVAVLVGLALQQCWRLLDQAVARPVAHGATVAWLLLLAAPQIRYMLFYIDHADVSVEAVARRGDYLGGVADTLRIWRRPVLVDHDMGGLLWRSGDRLIVRDTRGLVDLPFALHRARTVVVDQVLRDESYELPTFVHLHIHTLRALRGRPWFRDHYVEIPGVPTGKGRHDGQFVRRDVLTGPRFDGKRRRVLYDGVELLGSRVRSPEVAEGRSFLLEVVLKRTGEVNGLSVQGHLVAKDDTVAASFTLEPGQGLYPPSEWRVGDEQHDQHIVRLPSAISEGWYDLLLIVTDGEGEPLPFTRRTTRAQPLRSPYELRYDNAVRVVSADAMNTAAAEDLDKAFEKAKDRSCKTAESAWDLAIAHRAGSLDWRTSRADEVHAALAACWANRARRKADDLRRTEPEVWERYDTPQEMLLDAVDDVLRARTWDPREPTVHRAASKVGALCLGKALAREQAGEAEVARQWFDRAARVQPELVWARRRAEALRVELYGIPVLDGQPMGPRSPQTRPKAPARGKAPFRGKPAPRGKGRKAPRSSGQ